MSDRTGKNARHVGKKYKNNSGSIGTIIDVMTPSDPRTNLRDGRGGTLVFIEFESGFSDWFNIRNVRKGSFKDYGIPTKLGGYSHKNADRSIYEVWTSMLKRCYDKNNKDYHNYGERGVIVCERWKHLINFEEDIKEIDGYKKWIDNPKNYSLDKDSIRKDNKIYCKDYCRFASNIEQASYRSIVVAVESIDELGDKREFISIAEASRELGLNPSRVSIVAHGKDWQQTGGYRFRIINKQQLK